MEDPILSDSNQNEITCKNCSAKLEFLAGTKNLKCPYCGAENKIEVDENKRLEAIQEIDFLSFINEQAASAQQIEVVTIKCNGCGAQTTFDENVVSSNCDFCGTPLVADNKSSSSLIKPKSILPFKIDEKKSKELFAQWLKKLWFAPNKLKDFARRKKLQGVYIPYWTYDSRTDTYYEGQQGIDYQETEEYTNSEGETETRTVTRTEWYPVSGNVHQDFDDILVAATKSLPEKYIDELEPWDLQNLMPYDGKYLSGFKAESYRIDVEQGFEIAKQKMENAIRQTVKADIGGDHQRISSLDINHDDITFKHTLLPIWISAYKYNDKTYRFMINGRTGEVQGERPYSWIKITLLILFILAVIAVIVYFVQQNK